MTKIVLTGYMGCGKTTVGKLVANRLNLPFIDLDDCLAEHEKKTVSDIFSSKGEIYFRKLEHAIFEKLLTNKQSFVLSLGGGTPCYANNHLLLQLDACHSFYLQTKVSDLVDRLSRKKNTRPLIAKLTDGELPSFVGQHVLERNYYYRFAKKIIDTTGLSANQIADNIIDLTQQN